VSSQPVVQAWRPLGEADLRAAGERVEAVLQRYSQRWFTSHRLVVAERALVAPGALPPEALQATGALGLHALNEQVFDELALRALELQPGGGGPAAAPGSAQLIGPFAARMRADLAGVLAASCAPETAAAVDPARFKRGAVRIGVAGADGRRLRLDIWCSLAALMAWRPLSPPAAVPLALERRTVALGATPVHIEALLGSVQLAASHLVDLELGDVLVLDQPLSEPCRLRERASRRALAHGRLRRSAGRLAVELQPL